LNPSFPKTSNFQAHWQDQYGKDAFNPNALSVTSARSFMRAYTEDFRKHLGSESIALELALICQL
jgi:hypothetical protein